MVFYHTLNPTILKLWIFEIRWYGVMYIVGLVLAYYLALIIVKEWKLKLSRDEVFDLIVYMGFGLLIGGRIGYFLFYNITDLFSSPLEIFKIWRGGMSFHGGLIGIFVAAVMYSRKFKVKLLVLADLIVIPAGVGLFLGRIGNFINAELWGRVADTGLCVDYSKNTHLPGLPEGCRYPSQLIEAGKNIVIFTTLWMLRAKKLKPGSYVSIFLIMYGTMRFFIEYVREPDAHIGFVLFGLTTGQLLCIPMVLIGVGFLYYVYKIKK